MLEITGIGQENIQQFSFLTPDNKNISLELEYNYACQCWMVTIMDGVNTFKKMKVVSNINILYQWSNILDYGIGFSHEANIDPLRVDDFLLGNAHMYYLDSDDLATYATGLGQ